MFLVFLAKPKMSKKRRNVAIVTNPQPLQDSFQTFSTFLCFEARFRCRLLGQIHNLDTGHVYVLGFEIRLGTTMNRPYQPEAFGSSGPDRGFFTKHRVGYKTSFCFFLF